MNQEVIIYNTHTAEARTETQEQIAKKIKEGWRVQQISAGKYDLSVLFSK